MDSASKVFTGTINGTGSIEIEVTRKSSDSALARVVKMVSEAETRQSPTQRFTDKFERIFVPAVLALAFILLFAWVVIDETFRDSFYRSDGGARGSKPMCTGDCYSERGALGHCTGSTSGCSHQRYAPLEELGSLNAMAFDKTGTPPKVVHGLRMLYLPREPN